MINNCILVVIDGPDKTGKETQSKLLQSKLQSKNLLVERVEVPITDTNFHPKIYQMLDNGEASRYPEMFQTFQAANRLQWQSSKGFDCTLSNQVLILDRWDVSSWVYGGAAGLDQDFLEVCSAEIWKPDFSFIFEGSAFDTPERGDDCYEADNPFMATVRARYKKWAELNADRCKVVQANRPIEVVSEEIFETFWDRFSEIGQ